MNEVTRLGKMYVWSRPLEKARAYPDPDEAKPLQKVVVWSLALAFCVAFWATVGFAAALVLR